MVFFLGHGLVKDLCLLEANLKAKELSSICKGGFDLLQSSFCVGNKGSVIWGLPSWVLVWACGRHRLNRLLSRWY